MNITQEFDTIAAISTPLGMGGVGVIRISGDKAFDVIKKIYSKQNFTHNMISHGWIGVNKEHGFQKVDEVLVLPFFAPHSYTGEDVVEIHCHGGINIVKKILSLCLEAGCRPAEKGEFTKRAFLNKKMDLSQAEAVADLIHSKTQDFVSVSAKNLSGVLANKIREMRKSIMDVLSRIVAGIDFPEDVAEPEYSYIIEELNKSISEIDSILKSASTSNVMRQGVSVAIVGRPNVGKSSLFNTLLNLDRAIVTDIAGTTRDVLRETLDFGIPVTLIDTAGIREGNSVSKVEEIGIEYSKQSLDEADLVLFLYDASQGITPEDETIWELAKTKNNVRIANKCDLVSDRTSDAYYISTKTREGIDEIRDLIKSKVCDVNPDSLEFATNTRQQECLRQAKNSLTIALEAAQMEELQDLISIDIKSALMALDELTGEVVTDEVLNNIFDNFCIGK